MAARKRSKSRKQKSTAKRAPARKATRRKVAGKKAKKASARKRKPAKQAARKPARRPAAARKPTTRKPAAPRATRPAAAKAAAPAARAPLARPAASAATPASVAAGIPVPIGKVTHYYAHVNAAIVAIDAGELRVGDMVHFRGHTTDFYQRVEHMEVDHALVQAARAGQVIGLQVSQRVREHDVVTKVTR